MANTIMNARQNRVGKTDAQDHAVQSMMDVDMLNLIGRVDQAFAPRKAVRQIFQILRCRHEHGIANAVQLDGNRHLLGYRPLLDRLQAASPYEGEGEGLPLLVSFYGRGVICHGLTMQYLIQSAMTKGCVSC